MLLLAPPGESGDAVSLAVDRAGNVALIALHGGGKLATYGVVAWSIPERKLLFCIPGDPDWTNAVAVSSDGTWGVCVGCSGTPLIIDIKTGTSTPASRRHRGEVLCAAVLPDGERCATGGVDGAIKIWRRDGSLVRTLTGHSNWVMGLAPYGDLLLSLGWDQTVRFWSIADGENTLTLPAASAYSRGLAAHPDGSFTVGNSGGLITRCAPDGTELARYAHGAASMTSIAADPAGRWLAISGEKLVLHDLTTGAIAGELQERMGSALAFAGDLLLLVRRYEPHLHGFSIEALRSPREPAKPLPKVDFIASDSSSAYAVTAAHWDGRSGPVSVEVGARMIMPMLDLHVFRMRDGSHLGPLPGARGPIGFLGDGLLWSAGGEGELVLWDLATRTRRWIVPGRMPKELYGDTPGRVLAAVLPGDQAAFTGLSDEGEVIEIRAVADGALQRTLGPVPGVTSLVPVPHLPALLWASEGTITLSHLAGGSGWSAAVSEGKARSLRVDPTAGIVAAAQGSRIELWSLTDGAPMGVLKGRARGAVHSIDFVPGGGIVSASADGNVRRWDVTTGKQIWQTKVCSKDARLVDAHPDGAVVRVVGGMIETALLDPATGHRIASAWTTLTTWQSYPGVHHYAVGSYARSMAVHRFSGGDPIPWIPPEPNVHVAVAPDGAVLVGGRITGGFAVLDPIFP